MKTNDTMTTLFDLIFSGVFDRHPKLKIVLGGERVRLAAVHAAAVGLLLRPVSRKRTAPFTRQPSEIFAEHVFCTWLEDYSGTRHFTWWGQDNLCGRTIIPHFNMTFPHSRQNVVHHIGALRRTCSTSSSATTPSDSTNSPAHEVPAG